MPRRMHVRGDFMLVGYDEWKAIVAELDRLREVERLVLVDRDRSARLAAARFVPTWAKERTEAIGPR